MKNQKNAFFETFENKSLVIYIKCGTDGMRTKKRTFWCIACVLGRSFFSIFFRWNLGIWQMLIHGQRSSVIVFG